MIRHSARTARLVDSLTARVESLLGEVGVPCDRVDDADFAKGVLAPYAVVVLPYNRPDAAAAQALRQFASRGGKIIAFYTTGSPAVYELLGLEQGDLKRPTFDGQFERIRFTAEARRGWPVLPEAMTQNSWNVFGVKPRIGTSVIAYWEGGGRRTLAAATRNETGVYVTHILTDGDRSAKARFLLSCVSAYRPDLWQTVLRAGLAQAKQKLGVAESRWQENRGAIRASRREELARRLGQVKERLTSLEGTLAIGETDQAACLSAFNSIAPLKVEIRQVCFEMVPSRDHEIRGIWFFRNAKTDWDSVMQNLRKHGLNCIFVRVSRAGSAVYRSDVIPQAAWALGLDRDEVAAGVESAHRHGIEFHAWHVCFHAGSAPKDYLARLKREDRVVRDPNGKQSYWLNPGDPRNIDYECRAVAELVGKYDVDGIHLDYVRYPDAPHHNFDYGPVSRREFEKATGVTVASWPVGVISGGHKLAYEDWERRNIDGLVQRIYRETKRTKPWVQMSAAVWQRHRKYRTIIKQDWPLWVEQRWLDFVVPMDYVRSSDVLKDRLAKQVALAGGRVPIAAGIGSWNLATCEDLVEQIQVTRQTGADGFVLFSYNAGSLPAQLEALRRGATSVGTPPAFRSPRFQFAVPGGLHRKDQPIALRAGTERTVALTKLPSSAYRVRPTGTRLLPQLESLKGEPVGALHLAIQKGGVMSGRLAVPVGVFRPVCQGQVELADGRRLPYLWRGPLLEGLPATAVADLEAMRFPPSIAGVGLRVAVYSGGLGAEKLLAGLAGEPDLCVFPIHRLWTDHLAVAHVLILQQLADLADLDREGIHALRQWVEGGGRLILTHDAVGFRWHPRMFPEVGRGVGQGKGKVVAARVPIGRRAPGWTFEHSYVDHVRLHVGDTAQVLLTEVMAGNAPVVVSGRVDKGLVILSGVLPAYTEADLSEEERELFVGLAQLPVAEIR